MSSFRLSRFFSQPEILRGIDPENLLSLLANHEPALGALGLKLPDVAATQTFDYDALAALLMQPDKLPADLREAFYFIHEMATAEGMECLLDAAEEAGIEIVGAPAPTPGDTAIQVWLKDRELLERKHAEQFLRSPRTFESFSTAASPVPEYRDPMALAAEMKKDLDDFFEKRKRGRNTKVFPYQPVEELGSAYAAARRGGGGAAIQAAGLGGWGLATTAKRVNRRARCLNRSFRSRANAAQSAAGRPCRLRGVPTPNSLRMIRPRLNAAAWSR